MTIAKPGPAGIPSASPQGLPKQTSARDLLVRYGLATALAAGVAALVVWGVTAHVCEQLHQENRIKVASLAATIAAGIPSEEIRGLRTRESEESPAFRDLRYRLISARQANPDMRRVYAILPGRSPGLWHFALDAGTKPGERIHIGDPYDASGRPEVEAAIHGATADHTPSHDRRGSWLGGYAPIRDAEGRVLAVVGVDVTADVALVSERRFRLEALLSYALIFFGILFTGFDRYQKRRLELERNRNIQVRLSIHRLAEAMTRAGAEPDLVRAALDAIAEGTGYAHWALFRRDRDSGGLDLVAERGLAEAGPEALKPDPIAPEAAWHASRAASRCEVVISHNAGEYSPYPFAAHVPGLGPHPETVAVPMIEHGEAVAVLQCFAPGTRSFTPDDVTLIRWMAGQLAQGLKRIQLESRDQLLASYMRSTDELLIGFDLDGVVTYANPAAERALARTGVELRGRGVSSLLAVSDRREAPAFLTVLRASGGFSGEILCIKGDETRFPAEVTVSKASDREGNASAWVLVGRDISERRERDHEIQSRTEQLELINEQLQHANEKLAEANRMKNEFLANTSHELRTPLNAVIGFATLLEQGITESESERASFAKAIRESAEHLLTVINDILDLAKVEAGKLELSLESGDATPTVLAAVESLQASAFRKGLRVVVDVPSEPLEMELDPARLRQVLLNLLGNAIKFTDRGEVTVRARRKPTHEITIVVEDTGIGIAKDQQARLFVKFSQVDGSYKRRHQGTGLGLVITRSLVQRMGGTISMQSEGPGLGTSVTLTFPAVPQRERETCRIAS